MRGRVRNHQQFSLKIGSRTLGHIRPPFFTSPVSSDVVLVRPFHCYYNVFKNSNWRPVPAHSCSEKESAEKLFNAHFSSVKCSEAKLAAHRSTCAASSLLFHACLCNLRQTARPNALANNSSSCRILEVETDSVSKMNQLQQVLVKNDCKMFF